MKGGFWSGLILVSLSIVFLCLGFVLWWAGTLDMPDFDSFNERIIAESTKIYDRTGEVLLHDVHGDIKRRVVSFGAMSKHLKNATVAIEDSEFYEHKGIKPQAILRAILVNLGSGSFKQGGSTITQQLVKKSLLTDEKSIARKLKEIILALKLERAKSKEEILALYLNEAPYGGNIYGVEEAARTFFQKPASDLTLAEAAYLAAMPKAPTLYSPYGTSRGRLEERKNLVLKRMVELGFITEAEGRDAAAEKVVFASLDNSRIKAPHFVMLVLGYLEDKYGREAVETKGLKVITTLDWGRQQKAEAAVGKFAEINTKNFKAKNTGLLALDPKTGQILVMVGSKDYFKTEDEGNFNVTLARRQPGSAFKPFAYAAVFLKGYPPETVLFDLETQFDTACPANPERCYTPANYDNKFRGPLTMREALAQSVNVPSIKVLYLAGIKEALTLAGQMGISSLTDPNRYGLTLVLGGGEVSLLELTSAYGVFANDGIRNPHQAILKIEDSDGKILEEAQQHSSRVLPENIARTISDILSDNKARAPLFGPDSPLYFSDRQVAVKTGTTDDYRDAWVVGYTPSLVVGAWAGNNDNTPMEKKVAGFIVAPLWREFMNGVLKNAPPEAFPKPESDPDRSTLKPVLRGLWLGGKNYFVDKISGKLATEYTPPDLQEERVVRSVHSILYWLEKDNPRGSAPTEPGADPQFALWEEPVRRWAAEQGLTDEGEGVIPKDYDDIHRPEFQPRIQILSPQPDKIYAPNQKIFVRIQYEGRFPLGQLDVFANEDYLGSVKQGPFEFAFIPARLEKTTTDNDLRVVVYDSMRNKTEALASFKLSEI